MRRATPGRSRGKANSHRKGVENVLPDVLQNQTVVIALTHLAEYGVTLHFTPKRRPPVRALSGTGHGGLVVTSASAGDGAFEACVATGCRG